MPSSPRAYRLHFRVMNVIFEVAHYSLLASGHGEVRAAVDVRYAEEFLAGRYGPGARDQRLEEFSQGRWGDQARSPGWLASGWLASGWLALQVGDVSRPESLGQATG